MSKDIEKWDEAALDWDRKIAQPGTYRTILIEQALELLLPDLTGKVILDAGCGNGFFTKWMFNNGATVTGMDGSQQMVKIAKTNHPILSFKVQDFLQPIPVKNSSFDVILANMLLMHLANIGNFLSESKRILKVDGQLVISVLHPAFNLPTARLHKNLWQKLVGAKPALLSDNYYQAGYGRFESHMGTKLTHYHRTIEEYSLGLRSAGFCITQILEPHSLPNDYLSSNPKHEYATRFPRFIFFNCKPL